MSRSVSSVSSASSSQPPPPPSAASGDSAGGDGGTPSVPVTAYSSKASSTGRSSYFSRSSRHSKGKLAKKKLVPAQRAPLSPAERDLRLLSTKAAQSFKQTKFDLWLARNRLVVPYLFLIMTLSFSVPVMVLIFEELDPNFAEYGRWVWRVTTGFTLVVTTPMWIAMMQWRPATPLNGDPEPGEHMPTVDVAIAMYKEDIGGSIWADRGGGRIFC